MLLLLLLLVSCVTRHHCGRRRGAVHVYLSGGGSAGGKQTAFLLADLFHDPVKLVQVLCHVRRVTVGIDTIGAPDTGPRCSRGGRRVTMVTRTAVIRGWVRRASPPGWRTHTCRGGSNWRVIPFLQCLNRRSAYDGIEKNTRVQFEIVIIFHFIRPTERGGTHGRSPATTAAAPDALTLGLGSGEIASHSTVARPRGGQGERQRGRRYLGPCGATACHGRRFEIGWCVLSTLRLLLDYKVTC